MVAGQRIRGEGVHRRRSPDGPRRHAVRVLLSDAEIEELKRRATAGRVSVARYLVDGALGRPDTPTERRVRTAELARVERLLRGLATNVNQLAMVANATGKLPLATAPALTELTAVREAVLAIARAAGCVEVPDS